MSRNFLIKTSGAVVVCTALYAVAGYWGVPEGVRWGAEKYLKPALGAKDLTIDAVSFNPWTWELEISGVKAVSAKEKPLLTLTKLYADASAASLTNAAPVLTKFTVDGLKANISTASEKAKTATEAAEQTTSATSSSSSNLPAFSVSDIAVTNSAVTLTNPTAGVSVTVTDITLALPLVSTLAAGTMAPVTPEVSLKIDGKPVTAKGTATTSSADLHVSVANLDVAKLIKAAGVTLPVKVEKASVSTDADITFAMKGSEAEVTMKGTVAAGPADIREANGKTLATLSGAEVKIAKFDLAKKTVAVESAVVATPNITLRRSTPAKATAASGNAASTGAATADSKTSSTSTSSDWAWSVASARVTNGSVTVIDNTLSPAGTLKATTINVTAKNLSSAKNKAGTVSASAKVGSGTLKADGAVSVNPVKADMKTTVAGLQFSPFNPWVKSLAGAQFTSGSADVNGKLLYADGKKPTVTFAGDLAVTSLAAKNAKGQSLMTWKKATITSLNLKSIDPAALTMGELLIEQPAQKATQTVTKIAGLFGAIAAATGHSKTAERAAKVEKEAQRDIRIKNLVYENGKFEVNGYGTGTLETVAVGALNNIFAKASK